MARSRDTKSKGVRSIPMIAIAAEFHQYDRDFEWVLLVLLDRSTYSALEIWKANRGAVRERLEAPGSKARNERSSMGITQFTSIARRVWRQQNSVEPSAAGMNGETLNTKMTREAVIHCANRHCKSVVIQGQNTRFSNINASKNVWWLDIPGDKITKPSFDILNLLLYDGRPNQPKFHHLVIPIAYLRQNISGLRIRNDKNTVHLELSTERNNLLQDVIGPGHVRFAQFCHCEFNASAFRRSSHALGGRAGN